jgi:uncharacterized protein (TIGR00369 family)
MTNDEAQQILEANFAPWVLALGLRVEEVGADAATLRLPFATALTRVGGSLCGQAMMAAADTAMVIAISATLDGFRPMATVGQTISFMRPVLNQDVLARARVIKGGRTLVFGEITLVTVAARQDEKQRETVVAHATTTYALAP